VVLPVSRPVRFVGTNGADVGLRVTSGDTVIDLTAPLTAYERGGRLYIDARDGSIPGWPASRTRVQAWDITFNPTGDELLGLVLAITGPIGLGLGLAPIIALER
jgi:hypothetical protein